MMNRGARYATPPWLTDTDYPAPCPCGQPMQDGQDIVFVTHEVTGLKRILHLGCARSAGMFGEIPPG